PGAGVTPSHAAHDLEFRGPVAVAEAHGVLVAVALDVHFQPGRQRVDHAHAHAVQATGEGVVAVAELPARVQPGQDQLHPRHLLLRVDVHRHAPAVIADLGAAVLVEGHLHHARVPGQGLVDRVVDHFLHQVVGAGRVGVHAGAALDRIQAGEDFDVDGVVARAHAGTAAKKGA